MESKKIVEILRKEFAKIRFFTRIFAYKDNIVIWNDKDIFIKIKPIDFNDIKNNLEKFSKETIKFFIKKIDEKYKNITNRTVSVIIPNYNNRNFICRTIKSILDNTYKDIEIIVIDDCSTDGSVEEVRREYGENDKIKIYVNKENMGTYYGRNRGIMLSRGYYVMNVDGDDLIDREKIEYEVRGLERVNSEKFRYWGYGTGFRRLFHNGNPDEVRKITNQLNNVLFLTYRKTFNYLGFYHNSRIGSDAELFETRAMWFGMEFYKDRNKYLYDAYTTAGKNLTRTTKKKVIYTYHYNRKLDYVNKVYVNMGFLDDTEDFVKIAFGKKVE